jgi:hypothetical protein
MELHEEQQEYTSRGNGLACTACIEENDGAGRPKVGYQEANINTHSPFSVPLMRQANRSFAHKFF